MSNTANAGALNIVRRLLAERRQNRPSSANAAAAGTASGKMRHRRLSEEAPLPPSPSSAAQFLAETNAGVTLQQQLREEEELRAYWARLAPTTEQKNRKGNVDESGPVADEAAVAGVSPQSPVAKVSSPVQRPPRRISYYAGFLPGTLDREELAAAVRTTQRTSIDLCSSSAPATAAGTGDGNYVNGDFVVHVLSPGEKDGESVWGGATVSSDTRRGSNDVGGGSTSLGNSRGGGFGGRRRTTLSANFAGSVSGTSTSMSRNHSVTFDETLAEAMVSTSNRMKAHQQQKQQDQQRRRSSVSVLSRGDPTPDSRRVSTNCENMEIPAGEGGGGAGCRVSPPSLVPFQSESSMQDRPYKRGSVKDCISASVSNIAAPPPLPPSWQQHSVPTFPFVSSSGSGSLAENDRALTWADGMLPLLPDAGFISSRNSLVPFTPSSQQQQNQQHRKSSSAASSTYSAPARSLTNRSNSSRRSTLGSKLVNSTRDVNVRNNHSAVEGVSSSGSEAQLSHHQLTEAFYGSYKGGKMARDAYLFFVSQQQQQKIQTEEKRKRPSVSSKQRGSPQGADRATPSRQNTPSGQRRRSSSSQRMQSSPRPSIDSRNGNSISGTGVPQTNPIVPLADKNSVKAPVSGRETKARHAPSTSTTDPPKSKEDVNGKGGRKQRAADLPVKMTTDQTGSLLVKGKKGVEITDATLSDAAVDHGPRTPQPDPSDRRRPLRATHYTLAPPLDANAVVDAAASKMSTQQLQVRSPAPHLKQESSSGTPQATDNSNTQRGEDTLPATALATSAVTATAAVPSDNPVNRLDALWRRSARIYEQCQQQEQQKHK